jgi:hypothetical protein
MITLGALSSALAFFNAGELFKLSAVSKTKCNTS